MEIGASYYVLRSEHGWYLDPQAGEENNARLVVFTDHEGAVKQAQRVGAGTVVEHRSPREVNELADEQGFEVILIVNEDGGHTVVDVEH